MQLINCSAISSKSTVLAKIDGKTQQIHGEMIFVMDEDLK